MFKPTDKPRTEEDGRDQRKRDRITFLVLATVLIVLTLLYTAESSLDLKGFMGLLLLWVLLGYGSFFVSAHAYAPAGAGSRPDLRALNGIPAWGFFLGGGGALGSISAVWLVWGDLRVGLLLAGITMAYLAMVYPRPFSVRRAELALVGFAVAAFGLVFF